MSLNVLYCYLFVGWSRAFVVIFVMTKVARVQNVILERVEVVGERLDMMGSDEPLFVVVL